VRVVSAPPEHAGLARLLVAAVDELNARYPEDPTDHALDPRARFLVADVDGEAAGCVALVPLESGVGEIKRVFVDPGHRGAGIATRLLTTLEARARAVEIRTLLLETGVRQPESVALYDKLGFRPIEAYGSHAGNPLSLCYAKEL
jgi:putative acetyltransferase